MPTSSDESVAGAPADRLAKPDEPLRLSLSCPKCGVTGWVKWSSLARGIHCPKCRCEFLIGRTGHVQSFRDLPQTRFTCPRCGKSGSIPTQLVVRKAECGDCKLPLVAGPDQRLHGVKEAARLQRAAKAGGGKQTYAKWLTKNLRTQDGRIGRRRAALAAGALLAGLTAAAYLGRMWLDDSPQVMARRFTDACLAGDLRAARRYVADDDVQRAEFERFFIRHFASIEKKHRPSGDHVRVAVSSPDEGSLARTLCVTISSDFLGERSLDQVWHQLDDRWWFVPCETLAAQDAIVRRPAN